MDAQDARKRLDYGNKRYVSGERFVSSPSVPLRQKLATTAQKPYVAILTCSNSRITPEIIFAANMGEFFVVRNGGAYPSEDAVGSIQYAVEQLGIEYVLVLGHKGCETISSALSGNIGTGARARVVEKMRAAVSSAVSEDMALNISVQFATIMLRNALKDCKVTVQPAVFDLSTGVVTYL